MTEEQKVKKEMNKEECIDIQTSDPFQLYEGFQWKEFDVFDDSEMEKVFTFLKDNYVEDSGSSFRFAYPIDFLRWALTPPGYQKNLHLGVTNSDGNFVCLITAVPCKISITSSLRNMIEVNFLCVHKDLRGKRFTPILIKEIGRRANMWNISHAFYTSGTRLPNPISKTQYHIRLLNPEKLLDIGFSYVSVGLKETVSDATTRFIERSKLLFDKPILEGWRRLEKSDCKSVLPLFMDYMKKNFKFYHVFGLEEFEHWMCNRKDVVSSFVVENSQKEITDFISYFHLPSSVIGNENYSILRAAYLFYYFPRSDQQPSENRLSELMESVLIEAKNEGFDVFHALDIMENKKAFAENKFRRCGSGGLYYYLGGKIEFPNYLPREIAIPML